MSVVSFARIAGLTPRSREGLELDQPLQVRRRSQHDVDDVLLEHRYDRIDEFGAGAEALGRPVALAFRSDGVEAGTHVGVLGVGDDEIGAPIGAGVNAREFFVEPEHAILYARARRRRSL